MVYFMYAWANDGVIISSEDKRLYLYVKDIKINVPIETTFTETIVNDTRVTSGSMKFETNNDIVIKEKIAYIN